MTGHERCSPKHTLRVRCYAWVARMILPARFYRECGENLVETFSDVLRGNRARTGLVGRAISCGGEFLGLVRAAAREHSKALKAARATGTHRIADPRRYVLAWFPREFRHSLRALAKSPGVAISAVLALALGIGATTTMFSVSHGLLRDMPFDRADRVVFLGIDLVANREYDHFRMSVHELADWREQQSTLEGLAAFHTASANLSDTEESPERILAARITANAFDLLRVRPTIGRTFRSEEELPGAEPVVILGYALWKNRYGMDPDILDRTVRVNGVQHTVVGVMPDGFRFPEIQNLWIPLAMDLTASERGEVLNLRAFGRMTDESSLENVRVEFSGLGSRLRLSYPDAYESVRVQVIPYKEHYVQLDAILILNVMVAVVGFVLVIACANVANLLLARAASRSREVAVCSALGASRSRIVGQMLAESMVISLLGGVIGTALAYVGVRAFMAPVAPLLPFYWMDVRIDGTVLLFTSTLVLASGVVAGTAPALKVTGVSVSSVLKDQALGMAGLRLGRLSRVLVAAQVALSCGLLTVSGLMVNGVLQNTESALTFATTEVLTARLTLLQMDYPEEADRDRFYGELVSRLGGQPGIEAAAVVSHLPGVSRSRWSVQLEGVVFETPSELPSTRQAVISPEFFRALGVGLIEGREFTADDDASSQPVAIVNQRFATRFFPGESPLGRQVRTVAHNASGPEGEWFTIVGVAPDLAMNLRIAAESDGIYVPYSQHVQSSMSLVVRAFGDAMALVPSVKEAIASLDPNLPMYDVGSLSDRISEETVAERAFAALFVCFGAAALLLASVGLYGVMAFTVRRRTKELGIRMALGARANRILWTSARGGVAQLLIGLSAGVSLAALIAPALSDLLLDTSPWDWRTYVTIAFVLFCTGAVASVIPAVRATRVDPMETLRCE